MSSCTFFGHKDTPYKIENELLKTIESLIISENVTRFYVGNHGNFDFIALKVLESLKIKYPQIEYNVVLAYLSDRKTDYKGKDVFPEGIETIPKRFAISYRNKWMLSRCDFVITYVNRSWGGAVKFNELAEKQNKKIINIAKSLL